MEINNSLTRGVDPYTQTRVDAAVEKDGRKEAVKTAQQPAGDRISLSPEAMLRTAAHSAATQAPDVRQEKVDAIKERIAAGEYTVDSKKIAEKLLGDESALAGAVKP